MASGFHASSVAQFINRDRAGNVTASSSRSTGQIIAGLKIVHAWLSEILQGRSKQDIATENGLSIKRIQQVLEFAFLSPEIVQRVIDGSQPLGLTSDWCLTHEIPASWAEQSQVLERL